MRFARVLGYQQEDTCDVTGKKGPCFVVTIDDGQKQRVHQTRFIELLRFLFKTSVKENPKAAAESPSSKS